MHYTDTEAPLRTTQHNYSMDELYLHEKNPSLAKALACLAVLAGLRVKNAPALTAFLTLHPHIRLVLQNHIRATLKDQATVQRRIDKASNLISVGLLYAAIHNNSKIPKDYILIYFIERLYGSLNTPTSPILVSPTTTKYFKLSTYKKNSWFHVFYRNKHFLLFPLLYAQLLSNYLTPTQYKLNQKYLSSAIKNWIFNPIWINFHMGRSSYKVKWIGLLASYAKHNGYLILYLLLSGFREHILSKLNFGEGGVFKDRQVSQMMKDSVAHCLNKANVIANFIYGISLTSMLLLSVTLPLLTAGGPIQHLYKANSKQFIKNYVKIIGFTSALIIMLQNLAQPILLSKFSSQAVNWKSSRYLPATFFNRVNGYLLNLIALSKWRILKENHPWFTILRVGTWQRIESVILCYLTWEFMNLNDYVKGNVDDDRAEECQRIKNDRLIRVINKIMTP